MRVLIVEDEILAAEKLAGYIQRYNSDIQVVGHLSSVQQIIDYLSGTVTLDLIFADIELSDGQIFNALDVMDLPCPIIFTTSYSRYWIEAFQSQGVEYLLKPFSYKRFCQAMTNFEQLKASLTGAVETGVRTAFRQRFMLRKSQALELLPVQEVSCIRASGGVVIAYDQKGKCHILSESSLSAIESELDPNQFFRLNRSDIVHVDAIDRVEPYNRDTLAVMTSTLQEPLLTSKGRTARFRRWLDK
jgi:DNA-binding LytR/AlgR family response regulator